MGYAYYHYYRDRQIISMIMNEYRPFFYSKEICNCEKKKSLIF